MVVKIAPSLLAADYGHLQKELAAITAAGADWLHFDVMDGHFVPNLTFGPPLIKALRPYSPLPFDVHLMVTNPEEVTEAALAAGADHITFHQEVAVDHMSLLKHIKKQGKKAGLSIKPTTPTTALEPFLHLLDLVLVMTVEPGFGGQTYMPKAAEKLTQLRQQIRSLKTPPLLMVDGGITPHTAPHAIALGADCLVAGSAIFKHNGPYAQAIAALRTVQC